MDHSAHAYMHAIWMWIVDETLRESENHAGIRNNYVAIATTLIMHIHADLENCGYLHKL